MDDNRPKPALECARVVEVCQEVTPRGSPESSPRSVIRSGRRLVNASAAGTSLYVWCSCCYYGKGGETVPRLRWASELQDFTEKQFTDEDGVQHTYYERGSGPAVI